MKAERLAVYTVIYPSAETYVPAMCASVAAQTDKDFDFWVSVDGIEPKRAGELLEGVDRTQLFFAPPGATPAAIRCDALSRLVKEYPAVILVDSDDVLFPTRVEAARGAIAEGDVAGCALRVIDDAGRDLGFDVGVRGDTDWSRLLVRYNVFGLSNTAYRSETLARCLPIPVNSLLIDWLLAVRALAIGARLRFDTRPQMFYRQHERNSAKVRGPFSGADVIAATQKVVSHYGEILDRPADLAGTFLEDVERSRDGACEFQAAITGSPEVLERYVAELNNRKPLPVWWWIVAYPELTNIWKS